MAATAWPAARVAFYWTQGQPLGPDAVDFAAHDPGCSRRRARVRCCRSSFGTPPGRRANPTTGLAPARRRGLRALPDRPRRALRAGGALWAEHPRSRRGRSAPGSCGTSPTCAATGHRSRSPRVRRPAGGRAPALARPTRGRAVLAGLPNQLGRAARSTAPAADARFDIAAIHPYTRGRRACRGRARGAARHAPLRRPPKTAWVTELSWPAAKGKLETRRDRDHGARARQSVCALACGLSAPRAPPALRIGGLLVHVAVAPRGPRTSRGRDCGACARTARWSARGRCDGVPRTAARLRR